MNLLDINDALALATPGPWTYNCAGEIFAPINGATVRIGHFGGCADDAAWVCGLRNETLTDEEMAILRAAATPGRWRATEESDIIAEIDGTATRIGHFQGCAEDAHAVCALHNAHAH